MGLFGKSFKEKVADALEKIQGMDLGVKNLDAEIRGKVVTLTGEVPTREAKARLMSEFNTLVKTDNTVNMVKVAELKPEPAPEEAAPAEQIYEVVSGDTLGAIAKKFYGKASAYMKIFEANRDILDNPDLIKVGQKLKIPPQDQ